MSHPSLFPKCCDIMFTLICDALWDKSYWCCVWDLVWFISHKASHICPPFTPNFCLYPITLQQVTSNTTLVPPPLGSASASSGSTIIGENTGVFIGGLPEDFTLLREDSGKHISTQSFFFFFNYYHISIFKCFNYCDTFICMWLYYIYMFTGSAIVPFPTLSSI